MAEQTERSRSVATLILLGLFLAAIAGGVAATWIDDGDDTCGALYKPNLSRIGCTRKLMPAGVTTSVLAGGALLAWDAARRSSHRPSRGAAISVVIITVAVSVLMAVRSGADRGDAGGHAPEGAWPPSSAAAAQVPTPAPVPTPSTVRRRRL